MKHNVFLKQTTLQVGGEITFTFCTAISEQNDCTVLCETVILCTLDVITFNGILTQFTKLIFLKMMGVLLGWNEEVGLRQRRKWYLDFS